VTNAINKAQEIRDKALVNELKRVQAVNLALVEQNRLYEQGNSFFSDDKWGTALSGLESYNQALGFQGDILDDLNTTTEKGNSLARDFITSMINPLESIGTVFSKRKEGEQLKEIQSKSQSYATQLEKAMAGIAVKTKDRGKIANFFGAADQFKSLLDLYPELIRANGDLDTVLLKSIIDTEDLNSADRERLTELIELTDSANAAFSQFGDYVSGIFGGIGDEITQAFQTMYETGDDAMTSLEGSFSDMIETFTRDAIEFAFLQPYLNELNNTTKDLGEQFAKGDISADKLQADIVSTLGDFYNSLNVIQPQILKAYENADKLAEAAGFESAFNAPETPIIETPIIEDATITDQSRAGQISEAITEETGSELVGRMGAIMLSNERLANNSDDILDFAVQNLVVLNKILINTDFLPIIADNTRKTYEKLSSI